MKDEIKNIKFIEYNGIEGYIELMKHDVEPLNNPECKGIELYYNGKDIKAVLDYITNLQEQLQVSQTNEETFRLEMLEVTKILGLDEHTLFDYVKEKIINLQEENNSLKQMTKDTYDTSQEIMFELQEELKSANDSITWWTNRFNAVQRDYEDYKSRCENAIESLTKK